MQRDAGDQAQATPLMAAALGLVVLMLLALGPMGRALTDRAQARTAADAAALAGAAQGEGVARDLARANGAELVAYSSGNGEVVVEVQVGDVAARSRARRVQVARAPAPGFFDVADPGSGRSNLAPSLLEALQRADTLLGQPVPITSGFRSPQKQRELWERRHTNPFPVAPPGSSMHERGLAVDVPSHFVARLLTVADEAGLCQPVPQTDPIHFELCGAR